MTTANNMELSHDSPAESNRAKTGLGMALLLNSIATSAAFLGFALSGSMGLLADAVHM